MVVGACRSDYVGAEMLSELNGKSGNAAGASVYVLSTSGASNEAARWLAARENAADLVGGVALEAHEGIITAHAVAIINDADAAAPTGFRLRGNLGGPRVQCVFHQLLDHAGRALDHFACGNLVGDLFREELDAVHWQAILVRAGMGVYANLWTG